MHNEDRFLLDTAGKNTGVDINMANLLALIQKLFEANQNIRKSNLDRLNFVRGKLSHAVSKATKLGQELASAKRSLGIYRDAAHKRRLHLQKVVDSWPDNQPFPEYLEDYRRPSGASMKHQETACGGTGA